ncbi:MAG: Alpha-L-fucosidase, partial [Pedosphaera sp.]|nr:Alpha-L-fucosidase [Pedosphaera sp.]
AWMRVNSEAIYGTTASPFKRLSYGKCTQKPGRLYLHVFSWPKDGKLIVPIRNHVTKAYLLADPSRTIAATATDKGATLSLPGAAPDAIASVVVVELTGPADVIEASLRQYQDGAIKLLAEDADIKGSTAQLENKGEQSNIGYWSNTRDYVQWTLPVTKPGTFEVEITYSCEPGSEGCEYLVAAGNEKLRGKVVATGSWEDFKTVTVGPMDIVETGKTVFTLKAATRKLKGAGLMNLRSVVFKPAAK